MRAGCESRDASALSENYAGQHPHYTPNLLKDFVSAPASQHLRYLANRQAIANDRGNQKQS